MDTNVILDIFHHTEYTKNLLLDYADSTPIEFVILDVIKTEWRYIENMISLKYGGMQVKRHHLDEALSEYGIVTEVPIWYGSRVDTLAERLYNSKKYKRRLSLDTLSRKDCLLIWYAIDNCDLTLVTRDKLVGYAYRSIMSELEKTPNVLCPKRGIHLSV